MFRLKKRIRARRAEADPRRNRLLAALPVAQWLDWRSLLEQVDMSLGLVVYEAGRELHYVHFPISSIVAIRQTLADGSSTQIALVGCEGLVGLPALVGGTPTGSSAVVQTAGVGFRIEAAIVKTEFERGGPVMRLLLRYTQALIAQMSQIAVCNRHHAPEQQLSTYLLQSVDRLPSNEVIVTHELIASLLGLRRETITQAMKKLQNKGAIRCCRRHIYVINRAVLEQCACECYRVIKREYDNLLLKREATLD
jgi:CRP-like cAMP-binding protein